MSWDVLITDCRLWYKIDICQQQIQTIILCVFNSQLKYFQVPQVFSWCKRIYDWIKHRQQNQNKYKQHNGVFLWK